MSYTKTMEGVKYLVQNELDMACEENGDRFHSAHEAFAVIQEEFDELADEAQSLSESVMIYWNCVKGNADPTRVLSDLERQAMQAACEAIQIAAMARKAM